MKSVKVSIEETCVQEFEILVADDDEDNIIDISVIYLWKKYKKRRVGFGTGGGAISGNIRC